MYYDAVMSDPGLERRTVRRWEKGTLRSGDDQLAVEEPLEIRVGWGSIDSRRSQAISITMRTPGNDGELATGFLFTERVIRDAADIRGVEPCGRPDPETGRINTVRVDLRPGLEIDLARLTRHVYTTSSCGVCGKTSIDAVRAELSSIESDLRISERVVRRLPDDLRESQKLFEASGAIHAAALAKSDGSILLLREDVGRHNAVDKVIGAALSADASVLSASVLVLSGRGGFELVQKAAVAGIPVVVAVGAPSSLAVRLAEEAGVTLIGFVRPERFVIYSDPGARVIFE